MTESVSDHAGTVSAHAESQNDLAILAQRAANCRRQTREANQRMRARRRLRLVTRRLDCRPTAFLDKGTSAGAELPQSSPDQPEFSGPSTIHRGSGNAPSRTQPSPYRSRPLEFWRHSAVDLCFVVAAGGMKSRFVGFPGYYYDSYGYGYRLEVESEGKRTSYRPTHDKSALIPFPGRHKAVSDFAIWS